MSNQIIQFCNLCERDVSPKKESVSWIIVILLTFFTMVGGILYYFWKRSKMSCPICGNKNLLLCNPKIHNVEQHQAFEQQQTKKTSNIEAGKGCLVILVLLSAIFKIGSCLMPSQSPSKAETEVKNVSVPQFSLNDAATGGIAYLEKFYGAVGKKSDHSKKYPCESKTCDKFILGNGNEAIFDNGNLYWLTINDTTIAFDKTAIERLGFSYKDPDEKNQYRIKWNNYNGWAIDINGGNKYVQYILCRKLSAQDIADIECQKEFYSKISAWDGSYTPLVNAVKRSMNDPNSFEHVGTSIGKAKDGGHIVLMEYRGKNGFGGLVLTSVKVKVNCDGSMSETK